jgi:hypothetical protein
MYFCIQTKPEQIRQDKNSLLFFCIANTPPTICEKQNGSRAHANQSRKSARQKAGTHPANCDTIFYFYL